MTARVAAVASSVALAAYLATGLLVIPEGEVGVVRRFGRALREPWPPGLHWGLPWGFDRVDRLAHDRERSIDVGTGIGSPRDFVTGDQNVVSARARVLFRVSLPGDYLYASASADAALAALADSALARALAARPVDEVFSSGRGEVADRIRREVQAGADAQNLGVSVGSVRLVSVAPPENLAPAFADSVRARTELRQSLNRAEAYRTRVLADARGLARETADRAAARSESLVQSARGEADRFTRLSREVGKNPTPARQRMYLDVLAELLPQFDRTYVVAPGQGVDLSVTPGR